MTAKVTPTIAREVKKPKLSRLWMIWPAGALEWTITQSRELAKHAEKQGWGVIEFKEVRK